MVLLLGYISMGLKKNIQEAESVGKSRGGLNTKIHATVDALGNPIWLLLTAGHASEHGQANVHVEGFGVDYVLADKGYDNDRFIEVLEETGAVAVIPPRRNRKKQRKDDRELYKERNYQSMLYLVSSIIWLS